jgi:HPt (histidine-containing phosphotransfer) domain-containing protein
MNAPTKAQSRAQDGNKGAVLATGPIDLTHLRRFTLGDKSLELEILGLFIEQVPVTLESLKSALTDQDWRMAAHTLKGSSRAVGAWRLAKLSERAESLGGPSDHAACALVLREIEEAAAEAHAQVASLDRRR